jgi:hypothetical protein
MGPAAVLDDGSRPGGCGEHGEDFLQAITGEKAKCAYPGIPVQTC